MGSSFEDVALVLYYHRMNRYSFNALVGALERESRFDNLRVYFLSEKDDIAQRLNDIEQKCRKLVLAVSFMTWQVHEISSMTSDIASRCNTQKLVLIAGGPHPTARPKETLDMGFDIVIRGEGESAFTSLMAEIAGNENYASIPGISYNLGPRMISTLPAPALELDSYPPFAVKHRRFGPIEITRGCPWGCKFCQTSFIHGRNVRHRSVASICGYARKMLSEDLPDMRFISPNAFMYGSEDGKKASIEALADLLGSLRKEMGSRGRIFLGTFPSEVRPECVTNETVKLVKEHCDNDNLVIGAQSGSNRLLEYIARGHSVSDIYTAVETTSKWGLKANVDFIFGLPSETEEDLEATFHVIDDLTKLGARIHAHTFMPLPGTPFQDARPGMIDNRTRLRLQDLLSKGKLYGQWQEQERLGGSQR